MPCKNVVTLFKCISCINSFMLTLVSAVTLFCQVYETVYLLGTLTMTNFTQNITMECIFLVLLHRAVFQETSTLPDSAINTTPRHICKFLTAKFGLNRNLT